MQILAAIIAVVLFIISGLHFLWGLRCWWPAATEKELARSAVGAPGIERMPGVIPCVFVACILFGMGVLVIVLGMKIKLSFLPKSLIIAAGLGVTSVFLGRGVIGYLPFWRRLTPEQPFRSNDQRIYSPLCIALGLGFLILVWRYMAAA